MFGIQNSEKKKGGGGEGNSSLLHLIFSSRYRKETLIERFLPWTCNDLAFLLSVVPLGSKSAASKALTAFPC